MKFVWCQGLKDAKHDRSPRRYRWQSQRPAHLLPSREPAETAAIFGQDKQATRDRTKEGPSDSAGHCRTAPLSLAKQSGRGTTPLERHPRRISGSPGQQRENQPAASKGVHVPRTCHSVRCTTGSAPAPPQGLLGKVSVWAETAPQDYRQGLRGD